MSEEQQPIPGVLVSGVPGHEPQTLSQDEYAALNTCLAFYRSDEPQLRAIAAAIRGCPRSERITDTHTLKWFFMQLCGHLGDCWDDVDSILTQDYEEPLFLHRPDTYDNCEFDERKSLAAFLKVLRSGGWFAHWLDSQVRTCAEGKNLPPTPLGIMQTLTQEAAAFEQRIDKAREVLRHDWSALGFAGTTPPDPAAYKIPEAAPLQEAEKPSEPAPTKEYPKTAAAIREAVDKLHAKFHPKKRARKKAA